MNWSGHSLHKSMPMMEILWYEIHSSWWASYVSNPRLQSVVASYFAWKTKRKYRRYANSMANRNHLIYEAKNTCQPTGSGG